MIKKSFITASSLSAITKAVSMGTHITQETESLLSDSMLMQVYADVADQGECI